MQILDEIFLSKENTFKLQKLGDFSDNNAFNFQDLGNSKTIAQRKRENTEDTSRTETLLQNFINKWDDTHEP